MYRVDVSKRAEIDLIEIGLEIESERGAQFANDYLIRLIEQIETLSEMPRRTRERTELAAGQHALILPPYMAFYRIEGDVVRVQRVLLGSRRITARMLRE